MSTEVRGGLRNLPAVGENLSGPLGPGLFASARLGMIIRDLQAGLAIPDRGRPEKTWVGVEGRCVGRARKPSLPLPLDGRSVEATGRSRC